MKDFSDVLSQAKKMQEKMKETQENLRKIEVEGVAGGETVKIILNGDYEVIEAEIIETSELINKELKKSNLPDEIRIGAILRKNNIIIPRSSFIFEKDDIVVFLAKKDQLSVVENMFRISSI